MVLISCRFMEFFLDWAITIMDLFKLAWAQFDCQQYHMETLHFCLFVGDAALFFLEMLHFYLFKYFHCCHMVATPPLNV